MPRDSTDEVARVLLDGGNRAELAAAIGAREVVEVTAGKLGRAWYHLGRLQRPRFRDLVAEGVRPLRALRGRDLGHELDQFQESLSALATPRDDSNALRECLSQILGRTRGQAAWKGYQLGLAGGARSDFVDRGAVFVDVVSRLQIMQGPADAGLRPLWSQLAKLPPNSAARARRLVAIFRAFVGADDRHEMGRRRTLVAGVVGKADVDAARWLADQTIVREPTPKERARRAKIALLTIALCHPRGVADVAHRNEASLELFATIAMHLQGSRLRVVWPAIAKLPRRKLQSLRWAIADTTVRGAELARAIELDVVHTVVELPPRSRVAYLDAVQRLRGDPDLGLDPTAGWFVAPFRDGRSWEPTVVLALLSRNRERDETVTFLQAMSTSGFADFGFTTAFEKWNSPTLDERPADFDAMAKMLNVSNDDLDRYVVWRRLLGHDEPFADSLRKPLQLADDEHRELTHLLSLPSTAQLDQRIASLTDPERASARRQAATRRARRTFERGLEVLRRDSFDVVLRATANSAFQRAIGHSLPMVIPAGLDSIMLLLSASNVDVASLRAFLLDVLDGRPIGERPANQKWLASMKRRGFDIERWCAGIDFEAQIMGERIRFQTEADPLHVLKMGSYFDTCLSLEGGFNAASTLTNAIDVNKQVIYGRTASGTVVARKLIAVTDDGAMLGYRSYAFEHAEAVDRVLCRELAQHARGCGFDLATEGRPTALHGTFWYDDGTEPWHAGATLPLPDEVPHDASARAEYALVAGFDDAALWSAGVDSAGHTFSAACAARFFASGGNFVSTHHDHETLQYLAAAGRFDAVAAASISATRALGAIEYAIAARHDHVREFVAAIPAWPTREAGWEGFVKVPMATALLPPSDVCRYVIQHIRILRAEEIECIVDAHADCEAEFVAHACDVLQASCAAHGNDDLAPLFRSRDGIVRRIVAELGARIRSPQLAKHLRTAFKRTGASELLWALANQHDDASSWAVRSVLKADPAALQAAAALINRGTPEDVEFAVRTVDTAAAPLDPAVRRDLRVRLDAARDHPTTRALSEHPENSTRLLAEHLDTQPGWLKLDLSRGERLRVVDGLFAAAPDLDAIRVSAAIPQAHGAALQPFLGPDRSAWAGNEHWLTHVRDTAMYRYVRAEMTDAKARALLLPLDEGNARLALGLDGAAWMQHVEECVRHLGWQEALCALDWWASCAAPADYEDYVQTFFDRHQAIFAQNADEKLSALIDQPSWRPGSYRLTQTYVAWAAAHDVPLSQDGLRGSRAAWVRDQISSY